MVCSHCGAPVEHPNAAFCSKCGQPLLPPAPEKKNRSSWIIAAAILGAAILIAAVILVIGLSQKDAPTKTVVVTVPQVSQSEQAEEIIPSEAEKTEKPTERASEKPTEKPTEAPTAPAKTDMEKMRDIWASLEGVWNLYPPTEVNRGFVHLVSRNGSMICEAGFYQSEGVPPYEVTDVLTDIDDNTERIGVEIYYAPVETYDYTTEERWATATIDISETDNGFLSITYENGGTETYSYYAATLDEAVARDEREH